MANILISPSWFLLLIIHLTLMTSQGTDAIWRRSPASAERSSCHVTQTDTGCRFALSMKRLDGGACGGQRRHRRPAANVSSAAVPTGSDVITEKLDEVVVKVTRMMKQMSVRSLRHLRQLKADLRKVSTAVQAMRPHVDRPDSASAAFGSNVTITSSCLPEFSMVGAWPSCYRFSTFNSSWHEAREYCSAFGANLLALDSLKEAHIIDYLLNSKPEYQTIDSWWTSGNFMVRNQDWMWTSKHHLKPITYSRWAAPSDDTSTSPGRMRCLLLDRVLQFHWIEANCADRHNFICEQDGA